MRIFGEKSFCAWESSKGGITKVIVDDPTQDLSSANYATE